MKIEVLYFEGCPNHKPAIERIRELLREESISAEVLSKRERGGIRSKARIPGLSEYPRKWVGR